MVVKAALDKRIYICRVPRLDCRADAVKCAKHRGHRLGMKQLKTVPEEGCIFGGQLVPDGELGEAPSLSNFQLDSTTLDARGIRSRFMSIEDTSMARDVATGREPLGEVPIMSGGGASGLEFGEGARASQPPQKEGEITSVTEALLANPEGLRPREHRVRRAPVNRAHRASGRGAESPRA
jgi:hypothetical protein